MNDRSVLYIFFLFSSVKVMFRGIPFTRLNSSVRPFVVYSTQHNIFQSYDLFNQ